MPKLKLGAVFYALTAAGLATEAVRMIRHDGQWAPVHGWAFGVLLAVAVLATVVLGIGGATRWGLIADEGPWICQNGWLVLIGLAAAAFVTLMLTNQDVMVWPAPTVVFLPHAVRRLQESYYDGVADAEREIEAVRGESGGARQPRS